MTFNTRDNTDIMSFPTLQDALDYTRTNLHVWKISFSLPNGERIRLVKTSEGWTYENIFGKRYL